MLIFTAIDVDGELASFLEAHDAGQLRRRCIASMDTAVLFVVFNVALVIRGEDVGCTCSFRVPCSLLDPNPEPRSQRYRTLIMMITDQTSRTATIVFHRYLAAARVKNSL